MSNALKPVLLLLIFTAVSCRTKTDQPPYQDVSHTSAVFHHPKYYRLYLPDGYEQTTERFPVVYFFHGWGGRYFSDDNAKLEYVRIKDLVDKYHVILVMWDGNYEEKEPRPYNIGYHEDITSDIQMKDYFLELVNHVDSVYRTKADRNHRGIIGFSMGGFLSYFLAGKYPDKVGAAVNMTGSPEFYVGTPKVQTLYPVRYAFKNLRDVKLRFHNSTADELTFLNSEVDKGARWEGGLNYDYWQFVGGHVVDKPGETQVFERALKFVAEAFHNPLPRPWKWTHYDLYPEFSLWDYSVKSNKHEPGFINLKRVTSKGFAVSTQKWLPHGPALDVCNGEITTAPGFEPRGIYHVKFYTGKGKAVRRDTLRSDEHGRLHFAFDRNSYEVGIFDDEAGPELTCVDYSLDDDYRLIKTGEENKISFTLFNRGMDLVNARPVKITLSSPDSSVHIANPSETFSWPSNSSTFVTSAFGVSTSKIPPGDASPPDIKFNISMELDGSVFKDELEVPVFFNVPVFERVVIDDGRKIHDSLAIYGKGNGNGLVDAGEQIMAYADGHRLRLYTDDPWIDASAEQVVDEVLPAKWPDGFTLTSVVKIDRHCPKGRVIECLASYETKTFMPIGRKVTWGRVVFSTR